MRYELIVRSLALDWRLVAYYGTELITIVKCFVVQVPTKLLAPNLINLSLRYILYLLVQ
jgi:hypothetical protein